MPYVSSRAGRDCVPVYAQGALTSAAQKLQLATKRTVDTSVLLPIDADENHSSTCFTLETDADSESILAGTGKDGLWGQERKS